MHALRCFLDVLYVAADCAADVAIRASTSRIGFRENKKCQGRIFRVTAKETRSGKTTL